MSLKSHYLNFSSSRFRKSIEIFSTFKQFKKAIKNVTLCLSGRVLHRFDSINIGQDFDKSKNHKPLVINRL